MDDIQRQFIEQRIATKLLGAALLTAFFIGILLASIQIFFDISQTNIALNKKAQQIMRMIKLPSEHAVSVVDESFGKKTLRSLQAIQDVHVAAIELSNGTTLAIVEQPLYQSLSRHFSDSVFQPVREYKLPLYAGSKQRGILKLALDTGYDGEAFIKRGIVVFLSGIFRLLLLALLLYLIFTAILTIPLNKLIRRLSSINLERPGQQELTTPEGHERNEIGVWVKTANKLLASADNHFNLRQKAEMQIMRLSHYDYLTRLPNRKALEKHLSQVIALAKENQMSAAVICMGIDDFKSLSAHVNFNTADHILVTLSDRIKKKLEGRVYIGRLGEDQFAIVVQKISQPYEAAEIAETLLDTLSEPFIVHCEPISISATIGITLFPNDALSVDALLQQAEFAMIMAKSRSHNRYQFYVATVDTQTRQLKKLEVDLHNALKNDEFYLVYQPQVDYQNNGKVVGAEALLRWQHPEKGLISPEVFIPIAEKNLDIIAIGDWVLESACKQIAAWNQEGYGDLRIAVNLSAIQLRDKDIGARISGLVDKYRISPKSLEIEVTETFILQDVDLSAEQLKNIKAIGVTLAMDDFGTGYSSLSYLKQFPFDKIKIDKSFVDGLPLHKENAVIVDAIIQLGTNFNLKVLAEGIEDKDQEAYLIKQGCMEGQGYFYGKPMTISDFIDYLDRRQV
ncbi:putative bifunctional diguanylate cyclase/phosphodiesterase [Candidatus Sororendozoicomonas aggregata]|uniref:putative bifunctional diguanylate cyclase/phosphodiesterase n=1 Tax=Candidatus Sororendozoicomonas aggregata TaxID=3073239 RepID=UPI002ED134E5